MAAAALGALALAGTSSSAWAFAGHLQAAPVAQAKGLSVAGTTVFDCVLSPFNSAFRYEGEFVGRAVKVDGTEDQHILKLAAPAMPGIAPVPISGGRMESSFSATVGDTPVVFESETAVNAEAMAEVSMPEAVSPAFTGARGAELVLEKFAFAFDEIEGLTITAECEVAKGASLGSFSAGGGDESATVVTGEVSEVPAVAAESNSGLPAAWIAGGAAVVLVGAGVAVSASRRRRAV